MPGRATASLQNPDVKTMMSVDFSDERMDPIKNPMPFDGSRLIYGGFEPIVEL